MRRTRSASREDVMKSPFQSFRPKNFIVPPNGTPFRSSGSLFRRPMVSTGALAAYSMDSTLFPVVARLALDTSNTCWNFWTPGADDNPVKVKPETYLPAQVWENPNPFRTTNEFIEEGQQFLDLTGEWYWLVVRDKRSSLPLQLWNVRPDRMEPVPDKDTFLRGWIYKGPDNQEYALGLDEVIQIRLPNPLDPYRGTGPVQAAMMDIDTSRYSADWNRNFFVNGAAPAGIITAEHNLSDDDFDRIMLRWREAHQGVNNAHRVALLEAGLQFQDNSFSQRDMQFAELRTQSSDFIRRAFGFPLFMLGDVADSNRANSDAARSMYDANLIDPRALRIKRTFNARFLPLFGVNPKGVYLDYEPLVNEDEAAEAATISVRATAAQTLISTGFDASEVCSVVGLPPMTWTEKVAPVAPNPENLPPNSETEAGAEQLV